MTLSNVLICCAQDFDHKNCVHFMSAKLLSIETLDPERSPAPIRATISFKGKNKIQETWKRTCGEDLFKKQHSKGDRVVQKSFDNSSGFEEVFSLGLAGVF